MAEENNVVETKKRGRPKSSTTPVKDTQEVKTDVATSTAKKGRPKASSVESVDAKPKASASTVKKTKTSTSSTKSKTVESKSKEKIEKPTSSNGEVEKRPKGRPKATKEVLPEASATEKVAPEKPVKAKTSSSSKSTKTTKSSNESAENIDKVTSPKTVSSKATSVKSTKTTSSTRPKVAKKEAVVNTTEKSEKIKNNATKVENVAPVIEVDSIVKKNIDSVDNANIAVDKSTNKNADIQDDKENIKDNKETTESQEEKEEVSNNIFDNMDEDDFAGEDGEIDLENIKKSKKDKKGSGKLSQLFSAKAEEHDLSNTKQKKKRLWLWFLLLLILLLSILGYVFKDVLFPAKPIVVIPNGMDMEIESTGTNAIGGKEFIFTPGDNIKFNPEISIYSNRTVEKEDGSIEELSPFTMRFRFYIQHEGQEHDLVKTVNPSSTGAKINLFEGWYYWYDLVIPGERPKDVVESLNLIDEEIGNNWQGVKVNLVLEYQIVTPSSVEAVKLAFAEEGMQSEDVLIDEAWADFVVDLFTSAK